MKLGISCAAWYGKFETEDAAAHLRNFPLDTCEIFLQTWSECTRAFGELIHDRLGDLPCTSVHPKSNSFESELFSRSSRQTEDAFQLFEGVCEAGEAFGAKYYVFHSPGCIISRRTPGGLWKAEERLERMRRIAASHGIEVLWENVSWCAMQTPDDVKAVRRLWPDLGFVLDVKQAYRAGFDAQTILDAMGPQLKHLHVLDLHEDGSLCLPGEGIVDFERLIKAAKDNGFDGAVILEPYEAQARDESALRRSLDFLREKIAIL